MGPLPAHAWQERPHKSGARICHGLPTNRPIIRARIELCGAGHGTPLR